MNFLYFIIVGAIAGWLAGKLSKGSGFGILGNIIVGILGALVGGLLSSFVGIEATNVIGQILVATGGAIVVLAVLKAIKL